MRAFDYDLLWVDGPQCAAARKDAMPDKYLICEGYCNPDIQRIDRQLLHAGRDKGSLAMADFVRSAVYTVHHPVDGGTPFTYVCARCGTQRQFGAQRWVRHRLLIGADIA